MRISSLALAPLVIASFAAQGQTPSGRQQPSPVPAYKAAEVRRWAASEARQGVAVDAHHFYAVVNTQLGKYDKRTGAKVAEWIGDGERIKHLNSCTVDGSDLICAHSNYPQVPMASSIEIFDTTTMTHKNSIPLGLGFGSLTWVELRGEVWWAGFANYDAKGGEPGRDHRYTQIVTFDKEWRRTGGYRLPDSVLHAFAPKSNSGGSWGDDDLLYLTGHDAAEIYVLSEPGQGATLLHVATVKAPLEGQAWAWDRSEPRQLYGITRQKAEVVVMDIPVIKEP